MNRGRSSQLTSVRIDTELLLAGKLLKARSSRFSHSYIYEQGLRAILKEIADRGDRIPENALEVLTRFEQGLIRDAEARLEELALLRKQQATIKATKQEEPEKSKRTIRVYNPDTGKYDSAVVDDS